MESPESEMQEVLGRSDVVGATTDEGKGRIFPCESCGADFEFNIGQQKLKCPYCGFEKDVELTTDSEVVEQDFHAMLERIVEFRELDEEAKANEAEGVTGCSEVRCDSCSGVVVFSGTLTSTDCPYCGSPIQRENVHTATKRVPVDGVLPFLVERSTVQGKLKEWVKSRWFAPGDFKKRGAQGKFNGVYLPYWTFDSLTFNVYSGERGENYTVRVGTGKNKRTETRTRWYPASGRFQRFFDDVLVVASQGLPENYIIALEPWPLTQCVPFTQQYLAGYLARTYDIELDRGFEKGPDPEGNGVDHVAFTYDSLGDLLSNYVRLRDQGILPERTINHGMTTSMYYKDPDGNRIELQVENFEDPQAGLDFMNGPVFRENPIGVLFDADELVERFESGVPVEELVRQGD